MAFSAQEEDQVLSEINITPLVDVMLVLLVAFVVTIPALTNAVHVSLPKTVTTSPPEQQKAVTVTVDGAGQIFWNDQVVAIEELQVRLADLKAGSTDPAVHLRADDKVFYGTVAKTMAVIERSGINRVSVLTDRE